MGVFTASPPEMKEIILVAITNLVAYRVTGDAEVSWTVRLRGRFTTIEHLAFSRRISENSSVHCARLAKRPDR